MEFLHQMDTLYHITMNGLLLVVMIMMVVLLLLLLLLLLGIQKRRALIRYEMGPSGLENDLVIEDGWCRFGL